MEKEIKSLQGTEISDLEEIENNYLLLECDYYGKEDGGVIRDCSSNGKDYYFSIKEGKLVFDE